MQRSSSPFKDWVRECVRNEDIRQLGATVLFAVAAAPIQPERRLHGVHPLRRATSPTGRTVRRRAVLIDQLIMVYGGRRDCGDGEVA
jgi:hypothetical protein